MLNMAIPERHAVRGMPEHDAAKRFGQGRLNSSGRPYPIQLYTDDANVYLLAPTRISAALGFASYVIPRTDMVSGSRVEQIVSLQLLHERIMIKLNTGLGPAVVLEDGLAAVDEAEVDRLLHLDRHVGAVHVHHVLNPLRALAGIPLLALGVSAAAAGNWELLLGFAIGGIAVLGGLGRVFARVTIDPGQRKSVASAKSSTMIIGVLTSAMPLAIAGVVTIVLGGPFLLLVGGIALSASFSLFVLYIGLLGGVRRAVAASD